MGFAFWLTQADSYKLAAWCDRQADFENNREHWTAADRREHRSAGSELGLDPASRTRLGALKDPRRKDDLASKYFRTPPIILGDLPEMAPNVAGSL
jgi:hypothetical protein